MVGLEEGVCLSGVCNPWGVSVWGGGRFDSRHEDSGGEREIKVLAGWEVSLPMPEVWNWINFKVPFNPQTIP